MSYPLCEDENPMNPNLTEIAYILDRSGSMQPLQEPAVTAFNDFIKSQLDVPGDARLTLIQFDDAYEVPISARPIEEVPQLTAASYVPRGSTALLDAIGRTIKEMDKRIQVLPENERPGKIIAAIFTDGEENSSHEFTNQHISDLIRLYRDEKNWEFIFLAANQDAIATASAMQMNSHLSGNVSEGKQGINTSSKALSRKVRALRMQTSGAMDQQATEDEAKSMDQIIQEEEGKHD